MSKARMKGDRPILPLAACDTKQRGYQVLKLDHPQWFSENLFDVLCAGGVVGDDSRMFLQLAELLA